MNVTTSLAKGRVSLSRNGFLSPRAPITGSSTITRLPVDAMLVIGPMPAGKTNNVKTVVTVLPQEGRPLEPAIPRPEDVNPLREKAKSGPN